MIILLLSLAAFVAGFIDGIVGGGGLIQLPALFIILPQYPSPSLLGTNKLAALSGTLLAVSQYVRHVRLEREIFTRAAPAALLFSFLGARAASMLNEQLLRPAIFVLLCLIWLNTLFRKNLGGVHTPRFAGRAAGFAFVVVGAVLGFYDGIFGPGTGSFLIFAFVGSFGFDFLHASASAKVVNAATNFAALAYFVWDGSVLYWAAVPMAVSNVAGSFLGSRLAIAKGSSFVRILFLLVVAAIIARFGFDIFHA